MPPPLRCCAHIDMPRIHHGPWASNEDLCMALALRHASERCSLEDHCKSRILYRHHAVNWLVSLAYRAGSLSCLRHAGIALQLIYILRPETQHTLWCRWFAGWQVCLQEQCSCSCEGPKGINRPRESPIEGPGGAHSHRQALHDRGQCSSW